MIWDRVWALKSRVLVPLYPLLWLFLFHKNLWPFILNIDLSTISSVLPIFYFPLQDWLEGDCQKILYDKGGILKNSALLKNILCAPHPTPPPPTLPSAVIMNAALCCWPLYQLYSGRYMSRKIFQIGINTSTLCLSLRIHLLVEALIIKIYRYL